MVKHSKATVYGSSDGGREGKERRWCMVVANGERVGTWVPWVKEQNLLWFSSDNELPN